MSAHYPGVTFFGGHKTAMISDGKHSVPIAKWLQRPVLKMVLPPGMQIEISERGARLAPIPRSEA